MFYPCGVCRAEVDTATSIERGHRDILAGRVVPWRVLKMKLPEPIVWVLFHWIAPWTWGRKIKRALSAKQERPS